MVVASVVIAWYIEEWAIKTRCELGKIVRRKVPTGNEHVDACFMPSFPVKMIIQDRIDDVADGQNSHVL